ncbi:flavin reductase family protein [Nocardiopsis deserti]|uniref:flavin reductase family protein n=1 Tax=Nocardiopsis deserti TaxID=2605988 RepID=UPI00123AB969
MPLSSRNLLDTPEADLRGTSRAIPSSVSVVSATGADGGLCTVMVSSLATASMEPPLVVCYLKGVSRTLCTIRDSGEFAVTALGSVS